MTKKLLPLVLLLMLCACGAKSTSIDQTYRAIVYSDIAYENTMETVRDMRQNNALDDKQNAIVQSYINDYLNARNLLVSVLRIENARKNGDDLTPILVDVARRHGIEVFDLLQEKLENGWNEYIAAVVTRVNQTLDELSNHVGDLKQ